MRFKGSECRERGGLRTEPWDKTQRGQGDKEEPVKETEKDRSER